MLHSDHIDIDNYYHHNHHYHIANYDSSLSSDVAKRDATRGVQRA
jgi:hypothetical protein